MEQTTSPSPVSRFRIEKYGFRTHAVYDRDVLVAVTLYRKGAVEVARRLNEAASSLATVGKTF